MKTRKLLGFTLIELLIVIAIIGILAVAFLPNLLDAPGKGRDAKRIADLGAVRDAIYIQLVDNPTSLPTNEDGKCLSKVVLGNSDLLASMGGAAPKDPSGLEVPTGCVEDGDEPGGYTYIKDPSTNYSFALVAKLENYSEQNSYVCADGLEGTLTPATEADTNGDGYDDSCYVILTQ